MTTSSIPNRMRRRAGTRTQAAPASAPATIMAVKAAMGGHPPTTWPTPAAAMAPSRSWPSAPMFQKPARKAMATAAPVRRMEWR